MAIVRITREHVGNGKYEEVKYIEHAGRVLEVFQTTETRNHSDTLDYTDRQATKCTYARVWLGKFAVPRIWGVYTKEPRALEIGEQFVNIDCTGLFVWRGEDALVPTVDADPSDAEMWEAHAAWQVWQAEQKAISDARAAVEKAAADAERAKKAAKEAAIQAKLEAARGEAAKALTAVAKGSKVRVGDKVGEVFWTGVTKYRGKVQPRVGVRIGKGREDVIWCTVSELTAV